MDVPQVSIHYNYMRKYHELIGKVVLVKNRFHQGFGVGEDCQFTLWV